LLEFGFTITVRFGKNQIKIKYQDPTYD